MTGLGALAGGGQLAKITDPLGRETLFTDAGRLTRVTVPGGMHADFQYDASGRLWKITDAAGDTYTFGYSGTATRVASITDPSGTQVWYTYGTWDDKVGVAAFGITNVTDSTVTFSFRPSGASYVDITDTKDGQSRTVRHIYDYSEGDQYGTLGVKIVDVGGLGTTEVWSYDSELRVVQHRDSYQTESGGKEHVHRLYYADSYNPGRVTKYIDPENYDSALGSNSPSYRFTYDSMGNITKVQTPEDRETDIAYVSWTKRPSSITIKDEDINGTPVDRTTAFTYWDSSKGYRLKTVTDARSNTTTLYYDSNAYLDYIDPPLGNNVQVTCNSVGDVTAVTDGNGNTTSYAYDGIHRLEQITYPDIGAGQKSKYFDWTCCGLDQVQDENGRITKFLYENYTNRLWKVIEDYGGLGYTTEYGYDEVGNVVSVKNARGNTRSFTYDDADRLVRADYPDSTYETWSYRDDGRVYQHRDGRNLVTTYRYDADDRLAGSGTYKAIDYPNDDDVRIVRDDDGLVTSFEDGTDTTSVVYYPSGWVKSVTDAQGKSATYEYDGVGNVAVFTGPDGSDFTYTRNAANQLASAANPYGASWSFTYDNGGRRTRVTRPGSYIAYEYNARDWITAVLNRETDDSTLYDVNYYYQDSSLWDHVGNPLKRTEDFGSGSYTATYRYDSMDRLTQDVLKNPSSSTVYSRSYGYDGVGNRTSMVRNGTSYTYTCDDNDKLTALSGGGLSASFGYDGAGNMTSVSGSLLGTRTMGYDDESRMTSVTYPYGAGSVTDIYEWNALGQRKRVRLNGYLRRYVYFGDRAAARLIDAGAVNMVNTLESGSYYEPLLGRLRSDALNMYPLYDGVGTVRRMVDGSGETVYSHDLDAFGLDVGVFGTPLHNPYRFGGAWGYMTDQSRLVQLGARFYWPELGRFIQQDPIGDGVNWYAYVGGNPVSRIDPEGLDWLDDASNFSAGFGDTLSYGLTRRARQWMGTDDVVNHCSGMYKGGEWAGVAHGLATGVAGGIKAAGAKAAGKEFSHFIPKRFGGPRSIWNGNYVTPLRHARHDPFRYLKGMRKTDKLLPGLQQLDRVPNTWRGTGLGAGWGLGGRRVNHAWND